MKTKPALVVLFLACILLGVLLLINRISPAAADLMFAATLAVTGVASSGFKR
jgi:hypothetical protein|uniref:hypothetical protein n=1 Tax=Cephaloticoccus sp. TaxID=1985742 RepID=UPI00404A44E4